MENKRYRAFMLVLYPDDEKHCDIISYIRDNINYALILHNRDIKEDGTIKKPHFHIIIRFNNARTISAVSNELDLPENYINPCKKDFKKGLLYLIHYGENNKVPYFLDEVEGDLKSVLVRTLKSFECEDDNVLEIISILDKCEFLTLAEFIKILCNKGLYSYFRRSQYTFIQLLKEHNEKY